MAAFRLYDKLQTFYGLSGQLLAGGYLKFYTAATTTPKSVYGEQALTTNNGSQIALDSSGRLALDVWGDGEYFVELYDSDDVKQGEADHVEVPGSGGLTIPALSADKFLTNDGSVMSWATIREVPDPTGHANQVLGTDGTALSWQDASDTTPGEVTRQAVTAAATTTIDLALGLAIDLAQAVSIASLVFSNAPSGAYVVSIRRTKDATATARTITWPSVKWPGGTAPTLTATSGAVDEIALKFSGGVCTGTYQLAFS